MHQAYICPFPRVSIVTQAQNATTWYDVWAPLLKTSERSKFNCPHCMSVCFFGSLSSGRLKITQIWVHICLFFPTSLKRFKCEVRGQMSVCSLSSVFSRRLKMKRYSSDVWPPLCSKSQNSQSSLA